MRVYNCVRWFVGLWLRVCEMECSLLSCV